MGVQSPSTLPSVEYDPQRAIAVGFFRHKGVMVKPSLTAGRDLSIAKECSPKQNDNV